MNAVHAGRQRVDLEAAVGGGLAIGDGAERADDDDASARNRTTIRIGDASIERCG